jgi:hypothetical protein
MCFLYNDEYIIFKPVEITIRRGLRKTGKIEEMNQNGF